MLLAHGAAPESVFIGTAPPLVEAARVGNPEMIILLVRHGANLNAPDDAGLSPLATALAAGHHEAAALLRQLGARS